MEYRQSSRGPVVLGLSIVAVVVASLAAWNLLQVEAADKKTEPDLTLKGFMRKKLDASSQILEGLAVEDAELIRSGAKTLLEMSKAERWQTLTDSDYREHSSDFRATVQKLSDAADNGNFDNAALQWIDAVKGCIECHQHVRRERAAKK